MISFETQPDRYNHWKLSFDGPIATLIPRAGPVDVSLRGLVQKASGDRILPSSAPAAAE